VLLAGLGLPVLVVAARALPRLDEHLRTRKAEHPLRSLFETFREPNHLNAFALILTLMVGGFSVFPFMSPYMNYNVGLSELDLRWIYMGGGALTFLTTPYVGKLADRYGKLLVYRVVAPLSAVLVLAVTHLPPVPLFVAVLAVATFMASNAGRMTPAMAMITSSVEPARRGGFLSANAAVQHLAAAMGSALGGFLVDAPAKGSPLRGFATVGWVAAGTTILSLWLAGRLRVAAGAVERPCQALGAAAEALADAPEPFEAAEMG
jgi:predicted MFS family arabinose efflux permease